MAIKIFFIGATGYIGGTTLTRILGHPQRTTFDITILLRDSSKVKRFESFGLKVIVGSLSDLPIIEHESSESDFVFQSADADNLPATRAILKGAQKKFEDSGIPPVFVHTSGSAIVADDALGMYAAEDICSDTDVSKLEAFPITRPHRVVHATIVEASEQGYVKSYIVMPTTIWGIVSNDFTKIGLQNPVSQQIPSFIAISVKRQKTLLVGKGRNIWGHVAIEEVGDLYYLIFDSIMRGENPDHGRLGYYFVENGEYVQNQIAQAVGTSLFELGKLDSAEPRSLSETELQQYPQARSLGTNARVLGQRSRSLGWQPTKCTEDLLASVRPEVEHWIKQTSGGNSSFNILSSFSYLMLTPWRLAYRLVA